MLVLLLACRRVEPAIPNDPPTLRPVPIDGMLASDLRAQVPGVVLEPFIADLSWGWRLGDRWVTTADAVPLVRPELPPCTIEPLGAGVGTLECADGFASSRLYPPSDLGPFVALGARDRVFVGSDGDGAFMLAQVAFQSEPDAIVPVLLAPGPDGWEVIE
jgi:hypothetical protein